MASAASKVEKGHQLYRDGRYNEALIFYTDAITAAKAKPQKIALHSNRAACYLKLHNFKKAAEECTSVLELDQNHSGALMLRAQTLVTLKEYNCALFDVNRLLELNPDSEVYQNLEARLRTQLALAPIPESEEEWEKDVEEDEEEEEAIKGSGDEVLNKTEDVAPKTPEIRESGDRKTAVAAASDAAGKCESKEGKSKGTCEDEKSKGWQAIPKPKGHSTLDYGRWDRVEDDSSEEDEDNDSDDDDDEDDDDDRRPQYRFRVKTVGVRPVK